jgi:hypothetical protein
MVDSLGKIFGSISEAGPSLANLVNEVAELIANLADSGAIESFFDTLSVVFGFLNDLLGNDIAQGILIALAPVIGVFKAIKVTMWGMKAAGSVFRGYSLQASGSLQKAAAALLTASRSLAASAGSVRASSGARAAGAAGAAGGGRQQLAVGGAQTATAAKNTSKMSKVTGGFAKAAK